MPTGQPLNDDNDLARRAKSDDFWIRRIFKFALLGCAVLAMAVLTVVLCTKVAVDSAYRSSMAEIIKNNAVSIIFGVTAILGVNLREVHFSRRR